MNNLSVIELISEDELSKINLKNVNLSIYKVVGEKIEGGLKLSHVINLINREKLTVTQSVCMHFCETNVDRELSNCWMRGDGRKFFFFEKDNKLFVSIFLFSVVDGLHVSVYDMNGKYIDEIILSKDDRIIIQA